MINCFTTPRTFPTEGARSALTTCTVCGAAVFIDPATPFDALERHADFHFREPAS